MAKKDNPAAIPVVAAALIAADGRVLIRPSGTEPLLRVMVEARDAQVARSTAERIAAKLALA